MITGDTRPAPAMQLHYASIQLQLNQDQTVGNVLRDLQGVVLDSGEKQQYDDLLARYRIRQADRLTDQGKLAAAYDTLAPALKARPDDKAAQAALARMYLASGDTQKARQLYRDVLSDQPKDAELYLGAAEIAAKSQDSVTARQYLDQAVKLGQSDPLVLRRAALLYLFSTAVDLLPGDFRQIWHLRIGIKRRFLSVTASTEHRFSLLGSSPCVVNAVAISLAQP